MKRLLQLDWDAIAGIIAAVAALIMHFLHVIEADILLMLAVVLIALLFLRDLRRERHTERLDEHLSQTATAVKALQATLLPPDAILVGPRQLRMVTEGFAGRAHGDMVWFHVCLLMFKPQSLFDTLLRPAIENPLVRSIQFVLDHEQQELWESAVLPKVQQCRGHDKVKDPCWSTIKECCGQGKTDTKLSGSGDFFVRIGTAIPERRMLTPPVVKPLDSVPEVIMGFLTRPRRARRRALALQAAQKPLRDRIVSTLLLAPPAARKTMGRQNPAVGMAGILSTTIPRVEQASLWLATAHTLSRAWRTNCVSMGVIKSAAPPSPHVTPHRYRPGQLVVGNERVLPRDSLATTRGAFCKLSRSMRSRLPSLRS